MAKINHFLLEYQEAVSEITGPSAPDSLPAPVIRRFVKIFRDIDDSRCIGMTEYPLEEILLTAFLAVLSNASTWVEIAHFGQEKENWLRNFLPFANGTPSHDTFRRVFSLLDSVQLETATVSFLMKNIDSIRQSLPPAREESYRLICVDGKEEKATGRKYGTKEEVRNLQTLHVYDASSDVCIFSRPIDSKTNEIPIAQDILRSMNLKSCIVTLDALHAQRDTVAAISDSGGDYLIGLKENQMGLLEDAKLAFSEQDRKKLKEAQGCYLKQTEKSHSQVEIRKYFLAKAVFGSARKADWKKLRRFLCVEKTVIHTITQKEHTETRYYITSLSDISLCAEAVRGHWCVENKLHWHLDYSFFEDDNSTMDTKAFTNLSLINKMCLSLCKLAQPVMEKNSLRVIRKRFSWNLERNLSILLNSFNNEALLQALENGGKKKPKGQKHEGKQISV